MKCTLEFCHYSHTNVLVVSLIMAFFLVLPSKAAPANHLFNIYKLNSVDDNLFKGKGKKQLQKQNKSKHKKKEVTAINGNDSAIQEIRPSFQGQHLLTENRIDQDHSELRLRTIPEAQPGQGECWRNHLIDLLRSHSNYLLYNIPTINGEDLPLEDSVLSRYFSELILSYSPATETLRNDITGTSQPISPRYVSRVPGVNAEPSIDPLLDALVYIQSRLGDPSQQRHSVPDIMRDAQQYMHSLPDYANRILNIDHRFQVYALIGTPSSESSAPDPLNRFNLNQPFTRRAGPALLGFVILRPDESGSITDSFLLELAFDTGNANEPTFRQSTNYGDNDNQAAVQTFNNPLCLESRTTSESHSPILSLNSPELESVVAHFIHQNSHRNARSSSSSDPRSRSGTTTSSSSTESYQSGEYEVPVDRRFNQREGRISQPINIPTQTDGNPNRNARRKENILYGQWSTSSSAYSSPSESYAYGHLPERANQDTRSGSAPENPYSEVSGQNQASGERKKEKQSGILNRLRKANKADTKATNQKTIWHKRNTKDPLPMPPDTCVSTSNQPPAELPICQRSSESDCILYESASDIEREEREESNNHLYEPVAPVGNGTGQQNPNPPSENDQVRIYDDVIIDSEWLEQHQNLL